MPGGWTMSMVWMRMPGQSWLAITASFLGMWVVMMVAMMLPSAAPMILLYSGLARAARAKGATLAPTSIFAGMYLAVWGVFSALAALVQWLLVRSGAVSEMTLTLGNQRVAGARLRQLLRPEAAHIVDEGGRHAELGERVGQIVGDAERPPLAQAVDRPRAGQKCGRRLKLAPLHVVAQPRDRSRRRARTGSAPA